MLAIANFDGNQTQSRTETMLAIIWLLKTSAAIAYPQYIFFRYRYLFAFVKMKLNLVLISPLIKPIYIIIKVPVVFMRVYSPPQLCVISIQYRISAIIQADRKIILK